MPQVTLESLNTVTVDTYIYETSPDSSNSASTTILAGLTTGGARYHSLIKFDLGLIPNDVIINSATLRLVTASVNGGAQTIDVHPVTSDWLGNVTWNTRPSFDNARKSTSSTFGGSGQTVSVGVTQIVREWVNGTMINHGFILKETGAGTPGYYGTFHSFDSSSTGLRPKLIIDYTIPSTGKKYVEYVGASTYVAPSQTDKITPPLPGGIQQGDLLFITVAAFVTEFPIAAPSGWTILREAKVMNNHRVLYCYKFAGANETNPTFSSVASTTIWAARIEHLRNVKAVREFYYKDHASNGILRDVNATTTTYDRTMALLSHIQNTAPATATPPLSFQESLDVSLLGNYTFESAYKYMHKDQDLTASEVTSTFNASAVATSALVYLEPFVNNPPSLTLTSPADNQVLSEGNTMPVQGTAGDTDNGNVVTVKYKINNGPTRAIASGVSDGSSPISFTRTLVYSNKRLWDGSTDIVGADLAEGVDHTLTVWAEDDQGGKSAEVTRKFRVIWNRPPTISGTNEDLGTIMVPPSKTYTVTEPEGNPFAITEKINGTVIRSFEGVAGREETVTIPHDLWIRLDLDTPHSLTVEATDSQGLTSTRTFTFVRTETHIEFMLDFDNPDVEAHFTLDGMPKRVLVTLERYLPPGSSIEFVKVCNNAMDEVPTWEDATAAVTAGRGYLFTNQEKIAENWRINIWVCIAKGTATERVRLDGYGGAFD
jgi:hypothetical protein